MKAVHVLALGLLALGSICATSLDGQQPPGVEVPVPRVPVGGLGGYTPIYRGSAGQPDAIRLAQQYAKSQKEEEKKEIRKKITDALNQQFDQHLKQQQQELEQLEKQIADLRTLLKKRRENKEDIVERRLDQLLRDAEGLGWNAPGSPQGRFGNQPLMGLHFPPVTSKPAGRP